MTTFLYVKRFGGCIVLLDVYVVDMIKYLLVFLMACTTTVPKVIAVKGEVSLGKQAVEAWGKLGFVYTDGVGDITIDIKREVYIKDGSETLGHACDLMVTIDPDLVGVAVQHVATHEVGHILLETNEHLKNNEFGVMNISPYRDGVPTWILEPTTDDYKLACRTIEVCVD